VLDTRNVMSFSGGQYLVWNVVGHVVFQITAVSGPNAVGGGIFFAPTGGSVSVTPSSVTLRASGQQVFTATVTGSTNQSVTWSISPNVGSMLNGTYTAPASITAPQVVTVTAQSAADSTAQGTATVNLQPPVSVSVTPSSVTLKASGQQVFTATVTGSANQSVTWSISPNVGTMVNGTY